MRIDAAGIKLITDHEGVRLSAYQDSAGVWTIGYGHTATARRGMKITKADAIRLLSRDVTRFEACVDDAVTADLTQPQYNALVSFAFNRGCNGFRASKLLALINEARFSEAADVWLTSAVTAGGKPLRGLVKRRKNEVAMFNAPGAPTPSQNLAAWLIFGSAAALTGRAG